MEQKRENVMGKESNHEKNQLEIFSKFLFISVCFCSCCHVIYPLLRENILFYLNLRKMQLLVIRWLQKNRS